MYPLRRRHFCFLFCPVLVIILLWKLKTRNENALIPKFRAMSLDVTDHKSQTNTKPWLIVFWSTVFGVEQNIHLAWKKDKCPVPCEVTSDRSRASAADAFIVHVKDTHMTPPNESVPWILWTHENPVYTPELRDPNLMSKFNLLQSYRLDSDFPNPVYSKPVLTAPVPFKEKTGLVMATFSNCEPVRTEYLRQLMQFVRVDSYGGCLKNKNGLIARYGSANGKDFKQLKTELAKKYKFSIVFFNQDCDYFVDDQLSHALDAGSVPVVMGTDKLDEFLPSNLQQSVIKIRNFKSPKCLAEYLKNVGNNETEYNKYLKWKWKGIGNISGTVVGNHWKPKYPLYCQMCVALSEGRAHKEGLRADNCKERTFEDWGIKPGA